MKISEITSCYIGPQISPEQFIAEHIFIYLTNGAVIGYDGNKKYSMKADDYCIAKKNHLARYSKQKENGAFGKVVVIFDELFLKTFQEKHQVRKIDTAEKGAFMTLKKDPMVSNFIQSLMPYYNGDGEIDETFSDLKREELLLILLKTNSDLVDVLFDFGIPAKLNLVEFMNRNYKFNVSMERFAYLTGRSLSAFKRDFNQLFKETPSRWLIKRRLQEAYFLIDKKGEKPNDIYLDLGFEDLSHFSFAFKKAFGQTATQLITNK